MPTTTAQQRVNHRTALPGFRVRDEQLIALSNSTWAEFNFRLNDCQPQACRPPRTGSELPTASACNQMADRAPELDIQTRAPGRILSARTSPVHAPSPAPPGGTLFRRRTITRPAAVQPVSRNGPFPIIDHRLPASLAGDRLHQLVWWAKRPWALTGSGRSSCDGSPATSSPRVAAISGTRFTDSCF